MSDLSKQYQCSMDESVEAYYRQLKLMNRLWRHHLQVILGLAFFSFMPAIFFPFNLFEKFKLGATLFALFGCSYFFFREFSLRRTLRRYLKMQLGTEKPIDTEFRLTEEGIIYRALGTAMTFEWANVDQFKEEPEWLEIRLKRSGLILFPKRIFTDAELIEWKHYVENHAIRTPSSVA